MSSEAAGARARAGDVTFRGVSKRYRIRRSLGASRLGLARRAWDELYAVRDVSFEARGGDALGIIGHNGAGKTTVLKLLSNITLPTFGEIRIAGRLSALIELGSGFHPELTGRENVYLNGSILGMKRREIRAKMDSITDFAGVQRFMDTPVKWYSSGMYVRLGFSIAAHLDADVLLLDEVLAVGDAAFQEQCLSRVAELKRNGRTIVFISHDLGAVERLCDRVILLERGRVAAEGLPRDIINRYHRLAMRYDGETYSAGERITSDTAALKRVTLHRTDGVESGVFRSGEAITVRLDYKDDRRVGDVVIDVLFESLAGENLWVLTTEGMEAGRPAGAGGLIFECEALPLGPGMYFVNATVRASGAPAGAEFERRHRCALIRVDPGRHVRGAFFTPYRCKVLPDTSESNEVGLSMGTASMIAGTERPKVE